MLNARWLVVFAIAGCSSHRAAPVSEEPASSPLSPTSTASPAAVVQARAVAPERDPVAAWSLTASDGSGLRLVSVEAKAVIEGPLAFTELHLRFHNAEDRIREGSFAITLPPRAALSRFATEEAGHMKEAEIVAKALARRAYDDFLHRGIDPALLEQAASNHFTARVFPIGPRETKHIVLSYSHELAGEGYLLPLRGLPTIDKVAVTLDAVRPDGSRQTQTLRETQWQPDRDFVGTVVTPAAVATGTLVAGTFPVAPSFVAAADRPSSITLVVDTSASRGLGVGRYLEKVRRLVAGLAEQYAGLAIEVVVFDQEVRTIYTGSARDFGAPQIAAIADRGAAGASDLSRVPTVVTGRRRQVLVTDGVVTAGLEGVELVKAFAGRAERLDVILAGGIRDERVAASLARSGTRAGDVFDLDRESIEAIVQGLGEAVRVDVPIAVANAVWFHPRSLASVRASTQVMVFARLTAPATAFDVTIGGIRRTVDVVQATPALLERAAARAELDELVATLDLMPATAVAARTTLRKEIELRSVAARVISSETTMLVLDSDADYARYGIDRKALADVLMIGPHGLEQTRRTFVASKPRPKRPRSSRDPVLASEPGPVDIRAHVARQQAIEHARTAGVLGSTTAHGSGAGYGRSAGFGVGGGGSARHIRSRVVVAPAIRIAQPVVSGSLDTTMVRRHIKRHINQITYCYERELLARPTLHGVMTTQFTIAETGSVLAATATGFDDQVGACIADVIKSIEFPAARGGGLIRVNYPFTFRTSATPIVDPAPPVVVSTPTPPAPVVEEPPPPVEPAPVDTSPKPTGVTSALTGKLAQIMKLLAKQEVAAALAMATQWRDAQPGDVLALIGVGEALEASGEPAAAARAYGSIIDLFGSRADFRRFAGERLERTGEAGRTLAIDTYRRAVADRPDQVSGHRLLAYALLRGGDHAGAFAAILAGVDREPAADRFAGTPAIFARDAGMIGAAYIAHGGARDQVLEQLAKRSLALVSTRSTRFLLYWETDANDVDLHVRDARGGHAFYSAPTLASGGELYADVTNGFGPECFEIKGKPAAGPYNLSVHYYAQGPMGYGMGLLQIVRFDGTTFSFDDRPYVIMRNDAYVSLGRTR